VKFDLHAHTAASDGTDAPSELIRLAASQGFGVIAVTDHDTVDGLQEAQSAGLALGVTVLEGIEISSGGDTDVHVLGYGIHKFDKLNSALVDMHAQRETRMEAMIIKLRGLGIDIPLESVMDKAQSAVGRAHLARVMAERGYAGDVKEAFVKYLSPGRPGYVAREKLSVGEAIRLIRAAGGVAVIAHPGQDKESDLILEARVKSAAKEGLYGLEAYHPSHSPGQCMTYERLARKYSLIVTGGSDYHGRYKHIALGEGLDRWAGAQRALNRLLADIGKT
jgi:predicted metal-dependent phosphoesterase TrpH